MMGLVVLACLSACGKPEALSASFPVPELVAVEADDGVHIVARVETRAGQTGVVTQVRVIDGSKTVLGKFELPPGTEPSSYGTHILAPIGTKEVGFEMDLVEAPGKPPTVLSRGPLSTAPRYSDNFSMDGKRLGSAPRLPDVAWYKDTAGVHIACALAHDEPEVTALLIKSSDGTVLGRRERGPGPIGLYVLAPGELPVFEVVVEKNIKLDNGQPWPLTTSTRHEVNP